LVDGLRLKLDQPMSKRVHGEFEPIREVELSENRREVIANSSLTDEQAAADGGAVIALANELDHLVFSLGE
jgi:hypothetical protein